ncbi:polyprenyl synthetase family protein [Spongisporangium articulatum]|uniref:Polyprenyl synthetase family protein n=1 Tax=Spongisporangium articulatum TaxID=3362603 RepID=A0ABW8AV07_9ACTN
MTTAPSPVDSPVDREALRARVDAELDRFLTAQRAVLAGVDPQVGELVDAVELLMRGGKRLRAAFAYWGWRAAGGDAAEPGAVRAAAALELFQAAALIHDDLMDGSDTRRGMPAVHKRFEALHDENGWQGRAERFGLAGGLLVGDMALAWSEELFAGHGLDAGRSAGGRETFDRMRTELLAGQYLDVLAASVPLADPAEITRRARHVIRFKSAKYSVEAPLLIGAGLAGGDDVVRETLSAFGLAVGEAFQLRDDVLGVFGDPAATGKPAGDDLREGKRTVLIGLTLEAATPAQAALVDKLLGDPELTGDDVEALRAVIVETGALDDVERSIAGLADAALARVEGLPEPARGVLRALAEAATARAH